MKKFPGLLIIFLFTLTYPGAGEARHKVNRIKSSKEALRLECKVCLYHIPVEINKTNDIVDNASDDYITELLRAISLLKIV